MTYGCKLQDELRSWDESAGQEQQEQQQQGDGVEAAVGGSSTGERGRGDGGAAGCKPGQESARFEAVQSLRAKLRALHAQLQVGCGGPLFCTVALSVCTPSAEPTRRALIREAVSGECRIVTWLLRVQLKNLQDPYAAALQIMH